MLPPEFQAVFDALPDGVISTDASDRILYANPAIERLLGWQRHALLGLPLTVVMPERLRAAHEAGFHRYLQTHEARILGRPVRVPGLRTDGTEVDIELTLSSIVIDGVEHVVAVLRDLRDRVELERQLDITRYMAAATRLVARLSSHHDVDDTLRLTVQALVSEFDAVLARVWLVDADPNSMILRASAGVSSEISTGTRARIDIGSYPFKVGHVARTRQPFFKNGLTDDAQFDQAWIASEGLTAVAALPLLLRDELQGVLVAFFRRPLASEIQDVLTTLAAMLATALEDIRLVAEAKAANRAKDEFIAMLGHELRNPLAPILTALELMELRGDEHLVRERDIIKRQAQHLVTLVDDLLDVSRVAQGKIALHETTFEITDALARAIELATPSFEARRHHVTVSVPDHGLLVEADATRLAQVFANLLMNAAKYTPPGGQIRVDARPQGSTVVVRVEDNGVGITPQLLPRIFDLFVQGPRGPDRPEGGLGIGLALVRSLVRLHGGEVRAESSGQGQGSVFTVSLPRLESPRAAVPPPTAASAVDARGRVLVVDDNCDAATMLGELLDAHGYEVRVSFDPVAALAEVDTFHPDVAILDIGLPVMDGYELARQISHHVDPPQMIAVTGYGQASDAERARDAGFIDHHTKPVDATRLLASVRAARRRQRSC